MTYIWLFCCRVRRCFRRTRCWSTIGRTKTLIQWRRRQNTNWKSASRKWITSKSNSTKVGRLDTPDLFPGLVVLQLLQFFKHQMHVSVVHVHWCHKRFSFTSRFYVFLNVFVSFHVFSFEKKSCHKQIMNMQISVPPSPKKMWIM